VKLTLKFTELDMMRIRLLATAQQLDMESNDELAAMIAANVQEKLNEFRKPAPTPADKGGGS
jgi:hypothetical protein